MKEFGHRAPELSKIMADSEELKAAKIKDISRNLARFPASPGFKQMQVCLRGAEARQKLEAVTESKLDELKALAVTVRNTMSENPFHMQKSRLMDCIGFLNTFRELLSGIASMPADPESKHVDLRDDLVGAKAEFEAGQPPLHSEIRNGKS